MNVYTTDKIRNVVLLGHGGCGKTSLAEAMAYLAGLTSRMGKIDDGNTLSDFGKEEQKRKFSINTSLIALEWGDVKINLLDTPGYFDFVGEVEEAVAAADAAIIVVSEETGAISLACNGNLYYDLSHDEIKSMLLSLFNYLDVQPSAIEEGRNDAQ